MSLPHGVDESQGWPYLLSQRLGIEYKNFAEQAADNLFIYHTLLENLPQIAVNDLVIVGWSHPSRKSFVLDETNPAHLGVLSYSLKYTTPTHTFFRSANAAPSDRTKWLDLRPRRTGNTYYDVWFDNYYSEHEQRCNFQSYLDSVQLRCTAQYIPFYFSRESVDRIVRQNDNFMLEFVMDNHVAIGVDDLHLNAHGHEMWADYLLGQLQQ